MLGVITAADNTRDCIGIVPNASVLFAAGTRPHRIDEVTAFRLLHRLGVQMGRGDVINCSLDVPLGGREFPIDTVRAIRTALQFLAFRGITVVIPSGNGVGGAAGCTGAVDLDQPLPASLTSGPSGAVMVGGVAPHSGFPVPFSRWLCSNFGSRVDCCAWGSRVMTLNPGAPPASLKEGTSLSSAIIAAVVASIQGILTQKGAPVKRPFELRNMFRDPALTSDIVPGEGIGRMPDLGAIAPLL
jgi:hypothetical protein